MNYLRTLAVITLALGTLTPSAHAEGSCSGGPWTFQGNDDLTGQSITVSGSLNKNALSDTILRLAPVSRTQQVSGRWTTVVVKPLATLYPAESKATVFVSAQQFESLHFRLKAPNGSGMFEGNFSNLPGQSYADGSVTFQGSNVAATITVLAPGALVPQGNTASLIHTFTGKLNTAKINCIP